MDNANPLAWAVIFWGIAWGFVWIAKATAQPSANVVAVLIAAWGCFELARGYL